MTPTELAETMTPEARAIGREMRHYIRRSVPVHDRALIGMPWGPVLQLILPLLVRIVIELFLKRYGDVMRMCLVAAGPIAGLMTLEDGKRFDELRSLVDTPESDYLPMVDEALKANDGSVWE